MVRPQILASSGTGALRIVQTVVRPQSGSSSGQKTTASASDTISPTSFQSLKLCVSVLPVLHNQCTGLFHPSTLYKRSRLSCLVYICLWVGMTGVIHCQSSTVPGGTTEMGPGPHVVNSGPEEKSSPEGATSSSRWHLSAGA